MASEDSRTRTITWDDPAISAAAMGTLSGAEYLRHVQAGKIPTSPFGRLLGYRLCEVAEGYAAFELEPGEHHCNPGGTVHGGVISALMDSALGSAVHTRLEARIRYVTVELKVNLVRPLRLGAGVVRCTGRSIHVGRQLATAEGRLTDTQDRLYAHGVATFMLFRP